jgi:hypothetical protein
LALVGLIGVGTFVVGPSKVGPDQIRTSVTRTDTAIEAAWRLPAAATLKEHFIWQSNGSLCGPASVANALKSLGEATASESDILSGTGRCWTGICILGLTLDELADVARAKTRRQVTVLRDLTPDQFQDHLRRSNDTARRYIINFDRREIFGAGAGHHSPIGGYLEADDLVFVLDVNRDFQPWLVERSRLFTAMDTWDGKQKRGLLMIE